MLKREGGGSDFRGLDFYVQCGGKVAGSWGREGRLSKVEVIFRILGGCGMGDHLMR